MKRLSFLFLILSIAAAAWGQKARGKSIEHRIDPPHWWIGMQETRLELLLHSPGLAASPCTVDAPGITILEQGQAENPDYRYIVLNIGADAGAGKLLLKFGVGPQQAVIPYELKDRENRPNWPGGLDPSDLIYLAMPDRFTNGDPGNDIVKGMAEATIHRDSMFGRHGGDLQGVLNRLDYLQDLGVSALWLNPVLENDQPQASYHGYAITDHYKVDRRYGDNALFKQVTEAGHQKGIKMVMDMVYNHIGDQHHLYKALPWANWIHRHPEGYLRTSYRAPVLMDPYASKRDYAIMSTGWFDRHMPDLNQKDPHLAAYLIQNSIWWIEYAGLDAFRIDTYAYPDLSFMQDLLDRIFREYPKFGVFGETWVDGVAVQLYFHQSNVQQKFRSKLPGVTDFQLYYAINEALSKPQGWAEGVSRLYHTLAADYLHADPDKNVVFLDNHDISRFYSMVGEDFRKFKMGLAWLMTVRGIPQIYYGTEILMKNFADPDGKVRSDFPGGWPGDAKDKFKAEGRTKQEQEAFDYLRTLARWRKGAQAIHTGRTTQFVPENGLYTYFRWNEVQTVMVVMNCSEKAQAVDLARFEECIGAYSSGRDVLGGEEHRLDQPLRMQPWTALVLDLRP